MTAARVCRNSAAGTVKDPSLIDFSESAAFKVMKEEGTEGEGGRPHFHSSQEFCLSSKHSAQLDWLNTQKGLLYTVVISWDNRLKH